MSYSASTSDPTRPRIIAQPSLLFVPDYLDRPDADSLLQWANRSVPWGSEQIRLFGRQRVVPRLVAWFGDAGVSYRYSQLEHPCHGWPPELNRLRGRLREDFGVASNFALLNRYRCGRDSMGWHADDEPELSGAVVSVSLGATRTLRLRPSRSGASGGLQLAHGTLLMHDRKLYHALPKTSRPVGERINLTFRQVRTR